MNLQSVFRSCSIAEFLERIDEFGLYWMAKRLSGNDTGLTGGHQSGLYLPREFVRGAFPGLDRTDDYNPYQMVGECYFPRENILRVGLRAIYYNSRHFPERGNAKDYNEFRLTRWGGRGTPVLNPENTGSICILAAGHVCDAYFMAVWVAGSLEEENIIEDWLGEEAEPGRCIFARSSSPPPPVTTGVPQEWLQTFPGGKDILEFVVKELPRAVWKKSLDELLLVRRKREYDVFRQIEEAHLLPLIKPGFQTVQEFIDCANAATNRRKSRTGTSLELHLRSIFSDERVIFATGVVTENNKKPDFVFPSAKAYRSSLFPDDDLHMLACKTCCKDRWRQALNEADRIRPKHLFTLQEGVSASQLGEMYDNGLILVVPASHFSSFPASFRHQLLDLGRFIQYIKTKQGQIPDLEQWTD